MICIPSSSKLLCSSICMRGLLLPPPYLLNLALSPRPNPRCFHPIPWDLTKISQWEHELGKSKTYFSHPGPLWAIQATSCSAVQCCLQHCSAWVVITFCEIAFTSCKAPASFSSSLTLLWGAIILWLRALRPVANSYPNLPANSQEDFDVTFHGNPHTATWITCGIATTPSSLSGLWWSHCG